MASRGSTVARRGVRRSMLTCGRDITHLGRRERHEGGRTRRTKNKTWREIRGAEPLVSKWFWRCGGKCGEACAAGVFSNWLQPWFGASIYLTLAFCLLSLDFIFILFLFRIIVLPWCGLRCPKYTPLIYRWGRNNGAISTFSLSPLGLSLAIPRRSWTLSLLVKYDTIYFHHGSSTKCRMDAAPKPPFLAVMQNPALGRPRPPAEESKSISRSGRDETL
jgi:hypothetical protein